MVTMNRRCSVYKDLHSQSSSSSSTTTAEDSVLISLISLSGHLGSPYTRTVTPFVDQRRISQRPPSTHQIHPTVVLTDPSPKLRCEPAKSLLSRSSYGNSERYLHRSKLLSEPSRRGHDGDIPFFQQIVASSPRPDDLCPITAASESKPARKLIVVENTAVPVHHERPEVGKRLVMEHDGQGSRQSQRQSCDTNRSRRPAIKRISRDFIEPKPLITTKQSLKSDEEAQTHTQTQSQPFSMDSISYPSGSYIGYEEPPGSVEVGGIEDAMHEQHSATMII
eukprot:GHVH01009627.1.p1 GENE.GHVH01009627.1~~GHVH01009627.1.p1  ORF type:complete len:279 (+),score=23.10 GHVH01009627.1:65-901(+)